MSTINMLTLLLIVSLNLNAIAQQKKPGKWYEGGTLHQVQIKDWKKATEENKLATCADFVAKGNKVTDMTELLEKSVGLRACINEATRDIASVDSVKVSEVAAQCTIVFK